MFDTARLLRRALAGLAIAHSACAAQAGEPHSFIIPPADGYGIGECLTKGGECGRVVADSWCEAHGLSSAVTFGPADDVTASIAVGKAERPRAPAGSFVIDCAE